MVVQNQSQREAFTASLHELAQAGKVALSNGRSRLDFNADHIAVGVLDDNIDLDSLLDDLLDFFE